MAWAGPCNISTLNCTTVKVTPAWRTYRSLQPVGSNVWAGKQVKSLICLTASFWHMGKILKSMGKLLVGERFVAYTVSATVLKGPPLCYFKSSWFWNSHSRTIRGKRERERGRERVVGWGKLQLGDKSWQRSERKLKPNSITSSTKTTNDVMVKVQPGIASEYPWVSELLPKKGFFYLTLHACLSMYKHIFLQNLCPLINAKKTPEMF